MISTEIFPTRLKVVEIKPLYKKGEIANTSNYRPITLLTSFSKIFENFFILDQFAISTTAIFRSMRTFVSELNHLRIK